MATPRKGYPAIPANIWWRLRERFVNAPPRGEVSRDYLANALGLGDKVAANTMPALRQVGLVDENNRPTVLASKWRDDQTYAEACREIIETVYPDSLKDVSSPENPDVAAAQRWFLNETGAGAPRARVLAVFYAMLAKAELNGIGERTPRTAVAAARGSRRDGTETATQGGRVGTERRDADQGRGRRQVQTPPPPSLSIAIQVYIDKGMDASQVDQVFASMARHLYGRE